MEREKLCYYLKWVIVIELCLTLVAWAVIINLDPLWMQLLAYTYLPILDLVTIVLWLGCRHLGQHRPE